MVKIHLKTVDGNYVRAKLDDPLCQVDAVATVADLWETFERTDINSTTIALKAHNGKFLRAENGGGGGVFADRDTANAHEQFRVTMLAGGGIALKTDNGKFLSAANGGGAALTATADSIDAWESFKSEDA